jgi:hypothetical protein
MAFDRGTLRVPPPPRTRSAVFAIGRHVWVACAPDGASAATLMDDTGRVTVAALRDGTEVSIVAWRPGWAGGTRYKVRATATGTEGWLGVANLRGTEVAPPAVAAKDPAPATAPAARDRGHRFGQRRW